ncbi:hypothetical protein C8R44DRAFT_725913 [Mycena epipterygia]|nr:hypothetical protein C8R44DRAFT_725913 [Mycena epipterygia]
MSIAKIDIMLDIKFFDVQKNLENAKTTFGTLGFTELSLRDGKASIAEKHLRDSHMDIHQSRADCMLHLGDIAKNRGDLRMAVELWKEAHPLFERSSQVKDMVQIDTRLASINENMPGTQQEAPVQLEAQLDEMSNVKEKSDNTAFEILEETPWVAA